MRVLAIDPGGTTGYCYANVVDGAVELYPFQIVDDVDEAFFRVRDFKPRYIICEDFEYRNRARAGLNLFPVQLIGVVRLYELTAPGGECALYLQKASQGKAYYTDTLLKQMKVYKRGVPHGMDATRHLLQWLTFGAGYQFLTNGDRNFARLVDTWQ